MSSQPISIPALPQEQPGAVWPTLVARNDDRAHRGPNILASGASGTIVGDSKMGSRASSSVRRSWNPATSTSSPSSSPSSPSSAPRQSSPPVVVAPHAAAHPLPQPTTAAPANQVVRKFTGKPSAPAPAAGTPPVAPAAPRWQMPAAPTSGPAAAAQAPRAWRSAARVAVAPTVVAPVASSSEEGRATVALTFGVLAAILPIVIVQATHYVGNILAFILAMVALIFAGRALSVSALSRGSRARAGWAIVIAVVVIVVWIIAFTQGY